LGEFNIWEKLDVEIARPRLPHNGPVHNYPSEASRVTIDPLTGKKAVIGKCLRAQFFRKITQLIERGYLLNPTERELFEEIETIGPQQLWKFKASYDTENTINDIAKMAGVFLEKSTTFFLDELDIKGELDAVFIDDDGNRVGIDYKSIYGYYGEKEVFGTPVQKRMGKKGQAKDDNVMQIALYAWYWHPILSYFKILYFSRGSAERNEFKVHVEFIPNTQLTSTKGDAYVFIDDIKQDWKISDLVDRYIALNDAVDTRTLPDREYDMYYSPEYIDVLAKAGELSKTDMDKWKKKQKVVKGDWRCVYCSYNQCCADKNGTPILDNVQGEFELTFSKESGFAPVLVEESLELIYLIKSNNLEKTEITLTDLADSTILFAGLGEDYLKRPLSQWARQV